MRQLFGCVSYVDWGALKLFELVKKNRLERLVKKRKDGKYTEPALWYTILNPTYTQAGRQDFFKDNKNRKARLIQRQCARTLFLRALMLLL